MSYYGTSSNSSNPPNQQQQQQGGGGYYGGGFGGQAQQQQPPSQQWATGFTQQQPQQQQVSSAYSNTPQQQSQQPQQQQQPAFWNPAASAAMAVAGSMMTSGTSGASADAMVDMASTAGKSFLHGTWARMIPGLEATMLTLRSYFAVDNRYVVLKMKKVLMPFLSGYWKRQEKDPGPNDTWPVYDVPIVDENAPDLYLPFMSLITYVLLCALLYGTAGNFDPQVIPHVTTKCLMTQVLEVLLIRVGFYMMQAPVALLDLVSYTGYKYLGLCLNMMVGLLLGHFSLGTRGYYVSLLWTASATSYFMLKTMANNIPMRTAATGPKREVMVLAFAASQAASMWFLSQTKFL